MSSEAPPTRRAARRLAALVALALLCAPIHGLAQTPEKNPTLQEKETARKLLDKGRAAEATGDLTTAVANFRAAHEIMGVPTTGIYLALALSKSGKLIEARDVALQASRAPKLPAERPERTRARDDATKLAADLAPRIPTISVAVQPQDAPGLTITIDGQTLPPAARGLPWSVDPGGHEVRVQAQGYRPESRALQLAEGAKETVTVALVAAQSAQPVFVPAPVQRPARDRGMAPAFIVAITGLSLGGATLVAAGVTGGLSLAKTADIKEQCAGSRCPASLQADADEAQTLATVSNVTLGVGGALAIAGGVALGVGLAQTPSRSRELSLVLSPTELRLVGRFR